MRFSCLAALVAASALHGVSAGPLAKRQSSESDSSSSSAPTAALIATTRSDGSTTTVEVAVPTGSASSRSTATTTSQGASTTTEASSTTITSARPTRTGVPSTLTDEFASCDDDKAEPFCAPLNGSTVYVGNTYYITWNPKFFPSNSTVTIKLQYMNDTLQEAWSSKETENRWGMTTIKMDKDWLQGYTLYNLTFFAVNFEPNKVAEQAKPYKGPTVTLRQKPVVHLKSQKSSKVDKMGLMIGLPVSLGFVVIVVFGLWFGMRKRRNIGIGNIMGRSRGYGDGKSRRQRMGMSKKGAIRLETQPSASERAGYRDESDVHHGHARGDSLGSLVSDDGIRPAPRDNQFGDEMQRQRTGR